MKLELFEARTARWLPSAVGIGVALATLIMWRSMTEYRHDLMSRTTTLQSDTVRNEIKARMEADIQALERIARRWEEQRNPSQKQWESEVGLYYHPACLAIQWVNPSFSTLRELVTAGDDGLQNLGAEFESRRSETLIDAEEQRETTCSRSIDMGGNGTGFLVCKPILKGDSKDGKIGGFILAVYRLDDIFEAILTSTGADGKPTLPHKIAPGYQVSIRDECGEIYQRDGGGQQFENAWMAERQLNLYGVSWTIHVTPSVAELEAMKSYDAEATLIIGLIVAALIAGLIHLAQMSRRRAYELQTVNQELQSEIAERTRIEAKLAEAHDAALESSRLKAEFLANMSHEIRTPMNGIIGMTELLRDTRLSSEQRDFTETIRSSSDALLTLVNDILDFSKIEAGKLTFETLDFDLTSSVEGAIDLLGETAQRKGIELASLIAGDVPIRLRGDPGRLRQVLTNLVGNAVKFTSKGEVVVRITSALETATHAKIHFAVTDTGIGISADGQKRLFQAFSQADGSTTRKYGGTGLGLAICKHLVELMEGEIGVTSADGQGSTFWFTTRFEKQSAPAAGVPPSRMMPAPARVLIVDDHPVPRKLLQAQLAFWGLRETTVNNSGAALATLQREATGGDRYRIIILNMQKPDPDALALARAIQDNSALAATRVMLISSLGHMPDEERLRAAGIVAHLTKPIKQSRLLRCLIKLAAGHAWTADGQNAEALDGAADGENFETRRRVRSGRILVVEDNSVNQKVVLHQLQKLGYSAHAVGNGLEALQSLASVQYDAILMDCQMPEMDGYEAAAEIRRREGTARRTPIIALTAHALQGDREKCVAAGMDDYLSKPVRGEDLEKALERWIFRPVDESAPLLADKPASPSAVRPPRPADGSHPHDAPSPVDMKLLREITDHDVDQLREVVAIYLSQTAEQLDKLKAAVAADACAEVKQIAHRCAGSSATCGVVVLVPLLRELERLGESDHLNGAAKIVEDATLRFEEVRRFFDAQKPADGLHS